jgi:GTP cyclohydrolase I
MTIYCDEKDDSIMVTSALRGIFKENPSSRSEILTLIYSEKNGKV